MTLRGLVAAVACLSIAAACQRDAGDPHEHGHDHGDGHGHDHDHGEGHSGAEEENETVAIIRWTAEHELFVELDRPIPSQKVAYHAHVTRLSDFAAVKDGRFTVRFVSGGRTAAEVAIDGVARPGIFTPEGPAPPAGKYQLEMTYTSGAERSVFDCGEIDVSDGPRAEEEAASAAEISFLKEQQWIIPFGTAWAEERAMSREIELPATLEPAAGDRLTIAAPTGGRFFHDDKLALAEGIAVSGGTVLGSIAPTVAGDDFSGLELAVEETKLEVERLTRERARLQPLVADGAIAGKQLLAVEAGLAAARARQRGARRRLAQVMAPAGRGGLAIKASLTGFITEVLVKNGEPVEPGAPLVRIAGTKALWAKARFVARPAAEIAPAVPTAVRLPDGTRVELGGGARFVSRAPVVDPETQLATWTAELGDLSPAVGTLVPGMALVLLGRVGEPKRRVAVPLASVIEINTRPFVFVQTGGESFEKRAVSLGDREGGFVEIKNGVAGGERIVTRGGFDIHLAAVMGTVVSHRH